MKIGLVLEGGAMRGMYTAGVLDVFLDNNIEFDGIIGTSAGALFGVNYLSKQKGRVIRYNKRFNSDKSYMGFGPLLREGNFISRDYAFYEVPRKLDVFDDETYKKSTIPFYAVVTEIESGEPKYSRITSVFEQMEVLRASGAMPFVSKPVKLGAHEYLDGGITDSIPYKWLMKQGYDKIIVILTRDMTYHKKPMSKTMAKLYYKKYPNLVKKLLDRHNMYNQSVQDLQEMEKRGEALVIRPSEPIKISRTERSPEKLQSVYDLGVKDGNEILSVLRNYINE